jgi:hypothetical protein
MTIAIGYHCWKGVVVAADTLVIIGQDVQEGSKLNVKWTKHGSFAIVHSSHVAVSFLAELHVAICRTSRYFAQTLNCVPARIS